jgi:predicted RNA-binding Zn-ribbon protein involved in translation (DUF1610 family)
MVNIMDPDLTIRAYGYGVHYEDTSTPEKVSYELLGVTLASLTYWRCPDCGSEEMEDQGSHDKCLGCGARLTMEYLENKIITSG